MDELGLLPPELCLRKSCGRRFHILMQVRRLCYGGVFEIKKKIPIKENERCLDVALRHRHGWLSHS